MVCGGWIKNYRLFPKDWMRNSFYIFTFIGKKLVTVKFLEQNQTDKERIVAKWLHLKRKKVHKCIYKQNIWEKIFSRMWGFVCMCVYIYILTSKFYSILWIRWKNNIWVMRLVKIDFREMKILWVLVIITEQLSKLNSLSWCWFYSPYSALTLFSCLETKYIHSCVSCTLFGILIM